MTAEQAISWLTLKPKDLPVFVLLGTDPLAPKIIREWAQLATRSEVRNQKVLDAYRVAVACSDWPIKQLPG